MFAAGFAIFVMINLAVIGMIPWCFFSLKRIFKGSNYLQKELFEMLNSIKLILFLSFIFPLILLLFSFFKDQIDPNYVFLMAIVSVWCYLWIKCRDHIKFFEHLFVLIIITLILRIVGAPLIFWVSIVDKSGIPNELGFYFGLFFVFLIVFMHAGITVYVLNDFSQDGNVGWVQKIKRWLIGICSLTFVVCLMIPGFFLNGVPRVAGIRNDQPEWRSIDKSELFKTQLVDVKGFKEQNGNTYFCSYSILNLGDYNILCPMDVTVPSAKMCIAFLSKNVSIVPIPASNDWQCGVNEDSQSSQP